MKLYLLNGGQVDVDRAVIYPGDDSHRHILLPVPQILIETEGKHLLIDTGMPANVVDGSDVLEREYGIDPKQIRAVMRPQHFISAQLAQLGLAPSDVDMPISTHLHFDHCGGNAAFSGQTMTVQRAEMAVANSPEYLPIWDAPGLKWNVVEGDWIAAPGVEFIFTPGHSAGHQSILVRFATGQPWLFTIDAVDTEEHWITNKLGGGIDMSTARVSMDRLKSIAERENARVIFGHDPAQWEALGMAPNSPPRMVASDG